MLDFKGKAKYDAWAAKKGAGGCGCPLCSLVHSASSVQPRSRSERRLRPLRCLLKDARFTLGAAIPIERRERHPSRSGYSHAGLSKEAAMEEYIKLVAELKTKYA